MYIDICICAYIYIYIIRMYVYIYICCISDMVMPDNIYIYTQYMYLPCIYI